MKIWCLYYGDNSEGFDTPEHFFEKEDLLERISKGLFGGHMIYVVEINTNSKEATPIFSETNTTYEYRVGNTKQLVEDVKKAVNRVI